MGKRLSKPGFIALLKMAYIADMVSTIGGKKLENGEEVRDWLMEQAGDYEIYNSGLMEFDKKAGGYFYSAEFLEETDACMGQCVQTVLKQYSETMGDALAGLAGGKRK